MDPQVEIIKATMKGSQSLTDVEIEDNTDHS